MGQILNAIEEFVGPVGFLAAVFAAIAAVIFMARHESKRRSLNRKKLTEESERDTMKAKKRGNEDEKDNL